MNGEKILRLLILLVVVIQIFGFVIGIENINIYVKLIIMALVFAYFFVRVTDFSILNFLVFILFILGEFIVILLGIEGFHFIAFGHLCSYLILLYFTRLNHKSFKYHKRDVFTLVLGSGLYTIIFFMVYGVTYEGMEYKIIGFLHLFMLYFLLIIAAMHFLNIRSAKSLWFFLALLNLSFGDFILFFDQFYLKSIELSVIMNICKVLGLFFLVEYMEQKSIYLKSETLEGF